MSKASKNTTKARQNNAAKLATMRRLIAELTNARETFIAVSGEWTKIEAVYMASSPGRPDYSRDMPPDVLASFNTLTVGQLVAIDQSHPYKVWEREHGAAADAEMRAHTDACNAIKARLGYDKAERATYRASDRIDKLRRQIVAIDAEGLEAIALKVLAYRLTDFEPQDPSDVAGLFATIETTAAKAGFNTRAKPVAK